MFKQNTFDGYFANLKKELSSPNLAGPPYIPHRIQDRKNCTICHIEKGSDPVLVPKHGMRKNCLQCHVQRQLHVEKFSR